MADVVLVPDSLREILGVNGSNDLVIFLNKLIDQKRQGIELAELHQREKLEFRLEKEVGDSESRLTKRMDAGFSN